MMVNGDKYIVNANSYIGRIKKGNDMTDKLKELEYKVNELANKLNEQYNINLELIKLIETIGNSEFNEYPNESESLNKSINNLKDMNSKFSNTIRWN